MADYRVKVFYIRKGLTCLSLDFIILAMGRRETIGIFRLNIQKT